jgi:hypothetical protein
MLALLYGAFVLLALVWFGHMWTAAAQLLYIVTVYVQHSLVEDLRK